ncbi:MAG: SpoIIE family protein phosphatase [Bacteroidales bacterium]|nr:SpoIIE family protein phosphatase [Bacteroidales bacterium]
MIRKSILISALCSIMIQVLTTSQTSAQTYSYRIYDSNTGLPGSYLSVLEQDRHGFLWMGLETGLFRYDGFEFHPVEIPDTIASGYPNALFCDSKGTMWIGLTDGSLYTWTPGGTVERVAGLEADRINRIIAGPDGRIWIVSQAQGIYVTDAGAEGDLNKISTPEGLVIFDISFTGNDSLLVATQDNLYIAVITGSEAIITHTFPELEYTWIQTIRKVTDDFWVAGTDGAGLYAITHQGGKLSAAQVNHPALESLRIPSLVTGPGLYVIAATRESGVLKIEFSEDFSSVVAVGSYDAGSGLPDNDVRTIFRDREENLWIGLFSRGLAAVTTNAFSFYKPPLQKEINFIGESQGRVIMGTRNGLFDFDPLTGTFGNFMELNRKTGGSGIVSWYCDKNGNIWIGTVSEGLWLMNSTGDVRQFYLSMNPGQNHINSTAIDNENIWLATLNGVVLLDKASGSQRAVYTTREMLPHNNVSQVVVTRDGEVLVATETDMLCYIHVTGGVRTEGMIMEGAMRNRIQSISYMPDGTVCTGTLGNGIFLFTGDTLLNYTNVDGLLSNYCYSTLIASDGRIWTGHEKGFSIINPAAGAVRAFGRDFGVTGDCLPAALAETSDGNIYVGTTDGAVVFNPVMEQKISAPPQAGIVSVVINNQEYPYRPSYNLPYRSSYTVEVNYAGISLRDPLNVVFKTKLENFDDDWTEPTSDRSVTYRLNDGHYRFVVEASARDNADAISSAAFELVIQKPFTRSWWFIVLVIGFAGVVVYVIILLRERAHRIQREFLESELRKRTAEVYEQKEELAQKNLDITESIKYAKRIQSSVLPDTARLGAVFKDAFVYFLPRDIVSGDFYWFDWIDKDRFIIVCADSTGHGVPGAFMSMIGTALLQDIVTVKKITKPSQILHELDRQIFSTLNQNQELESSNDGMDIVVCEFNIKTRHLVFASAMRPVILIIDGEQHYVRGNRSSVGGESVVEKFFDDQEYHLREGDTVYLFTDGYPDQFGGHGSKKMKISRLRILLDEIKGLPMTEQEERIRGYFFEWKGDNEQVDDVLLMGLKF